MKYLKSSLPHLLSLLALTFLASSSDAQHAALATNPSGTPFFRSVVLDGPEKKTMDFSLRSRGAVKGRVFGDEEAASPHNAAGISGVRVTLKSRDKGFENFKFEQFTDALGAYMFDNLWPGEYRIEIDPATLPSGYRKAGAVSADPIEAPTSAELPKVVSGSISGVVFIDRDNDAQFRKGKDEPIAGAVVSAGGSVALTDASGRYTLSGVPTGRVGLLVRSPKHQENVHVVFDLAAGDAASRTVNIPLSR